ncbi:hypothetical protein [Streptomyces sp. A0592]|uniref:hypothetical protein n=1 Tax=Streptomyces sp. A0592 TaxID=2563099 RepID=UPI00109E7C79|nr:hypothetical protein [Streptomyces sp. A0592]THA87021.1 hypothetical protein E6U81_02880 [Streptomyces sp. A0592]
MGSRTSASSARDQPSNGSVGSGEGSSGVVPPSAGSVLASGLVSSGAAVSSDGLSPLSSWEAYAGSGPLSC